MVPKMTLPNLLLLTIQILIFVQYRAVNSYRHDTSSLKFTNKVIQQSLKYKSEHRKPFILFSNCFGSPTLQNIDFKNIQFKKYAVLVFALPPAKILRLFRYFPIAVACFMFYKLYLLWKPKMSQSSYAIVKRANNATYKKSTIDVKVTDQSRVIQNSTNNFDFSIARRVSSNTVYLLSYYASNQLRIISNELKWR